MAERGEVASKLLDQILESAEGEENGAELLRLAEAYAWVVNPEQPHGSTGKGR